MDTQKDSEKQYLGFRATPSEVELANQLKKKTDENSTSAVLRKALKNYARMYKVRCPA